jgi:hypothetical protein
MFLLNKNDINTYRGMEVQIHAFLISALDGGEWAVYVPVALSLRERANLGAEEKRKNFPLLGIESRSARHYSLATILKKLSRLGIRNTFLLFS